MACSRMTWLFLLVFVSSAWAQGQATAGSSTDLTPSTQDEDVNIGPSLVEVNTNYQFSSLEVCSWPSFPLSLKHPSHDIKYFANAGDWKSKKWLKWFKQTVRKDVPNIVFLSMGLLSFLILVLWRLTHCCCIHCCRRTRPSPYLRQDPHAVGLYAWYQRNNSSRTMMWLKPVVLLLCVLAAVIVIAGLTKASKGFANQTWSHVQTAEDKVNQLADDTEASVRSAGNLVLNILDAAPLIQTASGTVLDKTTAADLQPIVDVAKQGSAMVNEGRGKLITTIETFRHHIVDKVDSSRAKLYNTTQKLDKAQFVATIVLLCFALAFLVILVGAMMFNIPGLFTFSTIMLSILTVLFFFIALAMSMLMAGARDTCPAAETIIKSVVHIPYITAITNFFFFKAYPDLMAALTQTDFISLPDILDMVHNGTALFHSLNQGLPDATKQLGLDPSTQTTVSQLTSLTQLMEVNANATGDAIQRILDGVSYEVIHGIYVDAKSFLCCTVVNYIWQLWRVFTLAGWSLMVMGWFCMALIGQYDKAPGAERSCCGCTRLGPFTDGEAAEAGAQKPMDQAVAVVQVKGMQRPMPRLKV